jgi:hypothetical protein
MKQIHRGYMQVYITKSVCAHSTYWYNTITIPGRQVWYHKQRAGPRSRPA